MTRSAQTGATTLHLAAAIIVNDNEEMLLVRKRNTLAFMQPGGKIDRGETPTEALLRELYEELSITIAASQLQYIGRYRAEAANEANTQIEADIFWLPLSRPIAPAAEIAEAAWVNIRRPPDRMVLAPLTGQQLIPLARQRLDKARGPAE
ncbi:NUDIX domain-containing protein [Affinibrenneria salicis]|uniref:NUDIX domain-containing protein n=1 Tax=Affinibrenneria salicis TaxID=2590031 RepID=A0A5J5FX31_9GAMM|nr:NUDIX domain-containing protein [Affinibrenneria salicis]KAA8998121.1 NUDIX domain-containing protein [Affinibrenneria salicis]